ncbi:hypothetical protein EV426DRAFT_712459 [Tirmania nivea]|nr:hypothetical protein EV426DRAFT_712459 [Tirmania nivea]
MPRLWKDTHPRWFSISENIVKREERKANHQRGKSRLLKLQTEKEAVSSNERPMSLRGGSRRDDIPFEDRDHPTTQYIETLVDKLGNPIHIPPPTNQSTASQPAPAAGSGAPVTSVPSPPAQNVQRDDRGARETRGSNFGSIFNNPTRAGSESSRGHIPPLDIPGDEALSNPVQPRLSESGGGDNEEDEYEMAENPGGAGHLLKSKAVEPTVRGVDDSNVNDQDDEITEAPPLEPEENPPLPPPAPTGPQSGGTGANNTQDQGQGDIPSTAGNAAGGNVTGGNNAGGNNSGGNNAQKSTWWARHKARREARRQFRANATPANNHSTPLSRCWEGCFCTPLCWCVGLLCGPIQWLAHNWCSPV